MRVKGSPIQFECEYLNTVRFPGRPPIGTVDVIFGRVVAVHIDDDCITDAGLVDVLKIQPLARMGYFDYTYVDNKFEMIIPGTNKEAMAAIMGSPGGAQQAGTTHFP